MHIYQGALVSLNAGGYAKPLAAGEAFAGVAYEEIDNTGGADGDKVVRLYTEGDFEFPLSGATQANVGDAVYASDDGTLTFTATANSFVGYCIDVPAAGTIILRLKAFGQTTP